MGVVHKARAPDGRVVAVKVLLGADPEAMARFQREVRLLGQLGEDAGFVPLLDSGVSPEGPYVVMPFLPGGTLKERLGQPLPLDGAVALGVRLGTALGRAPAYGIVH